MTFGLSELVALDANRFLVIERDNQAGIDARVKPIYGFNISGVTLVAQGGVFPTLTKTLVGTPCRTWQQLTATSSKRSKD
jgi:hypothetical protein